MRERLFLLTDMEEEILSTPVCKTLKSSLELNLKVLKDLRRLGLPTISSSLSILPHW